MGKKSSFLFRPFCKEGEKPEAKQKRLEAKVMIVWGVYGEAVYFFLAGDDLQQRE